MWDARMSLQAITFRKPPLSPLCSLLLIVSVIDSAVMNDFVDDILSDVAVFESDCEDDVVNMEDMVC